MLKARTLVAVIASRFHQVNLEASRVGPLGINRGVGVTDRPAGVVPRSEEARPGMAVTAIAPPMALTNQLEPTPIPSDGQGRPLPDRRPPEPEAPSPLG